MAVWKEKSTKKIKKGFSLIESLLCLSVFLMIILGSLEFFNWTRGVFFKLKRHQENTNTQISALDKIRIDLLNSGKGLIQPVRLKIIEPFSLNEKAITLYYREESKNIVENLYAGQTKIPVDKKGKLKKGKTVCLFTQNKGEIKIISSIAYKTFTVSTPLKNSYLKGETGLALLKKITIYLDKKNDTIRRKVNSSPAQPLLEDARLFEISGNDKTNLLWIQIASKKNKERTNEIYVFPKNNAIAFKD